MSGQPPRKLMWIPQPSSNVVRPVSTLTILGVSGTGAYIGWGFTPDQLDSSRRHTWTALVSKMRPSGRSIQGMGCSTAVAQMVLLAACIGRGPDSGRYNRGSGSGERPESDCGQTRPSPLDLKCQRPSALAAIRAEHYCDRSLGMSPRTIAHS
jgi:hypothetical protein